jgi:hypothetical protein
MDKRAELTRKLRRARSWILAVGLLSFAVEMFVLYIWWDGLVDPAWRTRLAIYDAVLLVCFLALWWFAQARPVLCCVLALALFWALHIVLAIAERDTLGQGLVIKALFTIALVDGILSAVRAERLRREIDRVFS